MNEELQNITRRYERRKNIPAYQYSRLNPAVNAIFQQRQRALLSIFSQIGITDLSSTRVLEVGCGGGSNLLELIQFGVKPENMVANELLPERVESSRRVLPQAVELFPGDATQQAFSESSFDLVYQSTVFSSILDARLQEALAAAMWRWVRPGGGVLWYDFTVNNPHNPDVRGVPLKRLRVLFPEGLILVRKVTLAPPLARVLVRLHPALYSVFNVLPFLRTHVLCYIQKP